MRQCLPSPANDIDTAYLLFVKADRWQRPSKPNPETKKKGKGAGMLVWGLMSLLILGLGGFGVTNFGGSVRAIGAVGARKKSQPMTMLGL